MRVNRFIFKFLAMMVPGLVLVDLWVGWRDSGEREITDDSYWVPDDRLGWLPRPGFTNPEFETILDSRGMRNAEVPGDAPGNEVRILGCGASRTYGAGGAKQSETWTTQLQARLDAEHAGRFRVLNGGVMAYSLVQSSRRAIDLIEELEPDLVFVETTPGAQMLLDPSKARRFVYVGEELVEKDVIEGWPEFLHGPVVRAHKLLLHSNLYLRHRAKFSAENEDRPAAIQKWVYSGGPDEDVVREMFERTLTEVAQLVRVTQERGIELRMMVYPENYQDSQDRWDKYLADNQGAGAPPKGTARLSGAEALEARCRELGASSWNFAEEITLFGTARSRYLNDQGHWSGEGHGIVADGLYERMQREGLIESLLSKRDADPR